MMKDERATAQDSKTGSLKSLPTMKRDALLRIKTIIGHAQGIEKMIESDRYCIDLLKQISAVQAQLKVLGQQLTRGHMEVCMAGAIRQGRGEETIDELMEVLKYLD